jgi:hypothetical protein
MPPREPLYTYRIYSPLLLLLSHERSDVLELCGFHSYYHQLHYSGAVFGFAEQNLICNLSAALDAYSTQCEAPSFLWFQALRHEIYREVGEYLLFNPHDDLLMISERLTAGLDVSRDYPIQMTSPEYGDLDARLLYHWANEQDIDYRVRLGLKTFPYETSDTFHR